jgi:hypothetical protein
MYTKLTADRTGISDSRKAANFAAHESLIPLHRQGWTSMQIHRLYSQTTLSYNTFYMFRCDSKAPSTLKPIYTRS